MLSFQGRLIMRFDDTNPAKENIHFEEVILEDFNCWKLKKIIIMSCVRSQTKHIGFLRNEKRLNVALTRAKALLVIIGNASTLQKCSYRSTNKLRLMKMQQRKRKFLRRLRMNTKNKN